MGLFDFNGPIIQCLSRVLRETFIPVVAFCILLSNNQGICFLGWLLSSDGYWQTIRGWFSIRWGLFQQIAWILRSFCCKGLVCHLQLLVLLQWGQGAGLFLALSHCPNLQCLLCEAYNIIDVVVHRASWVDWDVNNKVSSDAKQDFVGKGFLWWDVT